MQTPLPYEFTVDDLKKCEVIKVVCNDVELHELWDKFEDGELPQPLFTSKQKDGLYLLYFQHVATTRHTLETILNRKAMIY